MLLEATYSTCPLVPETQDTTKLNWNPVCHITYTRDSWVKLFDLPSEYSSDQALLLCQESLDTWVAWVLDHGEVLLDRSNFYSS